MWRVDWKPDLPNAPWVAYSSFFSFETQEEANTFMVREVFREPEYLYRVRFEEEK